MGVDRSDYLVYGWKLPYDLLDKNGDVLDLYEVKSKFTFIEDGMCGDYTVYGKVIEQSDIYGGFGFCELKDKMDYESCKEELTEEYLELISNVPITEPSLILFSHFR